MNRTARFRKIFQGNEEAYGCYDVKPGPPGQKLLGARETKRAKVTTAHWENHLNGEAGLGVIPIDKDNNSRWACLDIDKYNFDHKHALGQIKVLGLPLVVCRSKSGGAHIFLFAKEPVPAGEISSRLRVISAMMGYGTSEIFPKQVEVMTDRGDVGSWLNLPYFDAEKTTRYAMAPDGSPLSLDEFLDLAEKSALTLEEIQTFQPLDVGEEFAGGPPCLQALIVQGFPEGTRNNGLTALGIFAKKKYPKDWAERLEKYNKKYFQPPLEYNEVRTIIQSLERRDYNYKCKDLPLTPFCNGGLCRTRPFGVSASENVTALGSLTKLATDPPTWFLDVNGRRMELETEDLQNQLRFQKKCMEALDKMPPKMKDADWQQVIQHLLESVTVVEAPAEASAEGFFGELLQGFVSTDRSAAKNVDEILLGKPWTDPETKLVWFRLVDLVNYLHRNKFKDLTRTQVASKLKKLHATHETVDIKGQRVRIYRVPLDVRPTQPLEVPKIPGNVF